ncbi:MAG: phosphoadenylyl-sulfate reductase [Planctomycetota bacterium]
MIGSIAVRDIVALNDKLAAMSIELMLNWAVAEFGHELTFACSFGAEDMVLLDLLLKAQPQASVFVLDTGRMHQETYDLIEKARERYDRSFDFYAPETRALETLLREAGPNNFYSSVETRKNCCRVRKVEPLARVLAGKHAWLTGLRREQSVTRAGLPLVEIDETHGGILKLNPLAKWSEMRVWEYIRAHHLPYNALHDQGYSSIGCVPCTRAIRRIEDLRDGRWWWEEPEQKECGLHSDTCAARFARKDT